MYGTTRGLWVTTVTYKWSFIIKVRCPQKKLYKCQKHPRWADERKRGSANFPAGHSRGRMGRGREADGEARFRGLCCVRRGAVLLGEGASAPNHMKVTCRLATPLLGKDKERDRQWMVTVGRNERC